MSTLKLILGLMGAVCAVFGLITATELIPPLGTVFTWQFWFSLSVILFLASIAIKGGWEY